MKPLDIVLICVIAICLVAAVLYVVTKKKNGCSGCSGSCDGCPYSDKRDSDKPK